MLNAMPLPDSSAYPLLPRSCSSAWPPRRAPTSRRSSASARRRSSTWPRAWRSAAGSSSSASSSSTATSARTCSKRRARRSPPASGNLLVQTPVPISGWQFYATLGGGGYRERLEDLQETHVSTNLGGGAKFTLSGPFRLRFDYRIFSLTGSPLQTGCTASTPAPTWRSDAVGRFRPCQEPAGPSKSCQAGRKGGAGGASHAAPILIQARDGARPGRSAGTFRPVRVTDYEPPRCDTSDQIEAADAARHDASLVLRVEVLHLGRERLRRSACRSRCSSDPPRPGR